MLVIAIDYIAAPLGSFAIVAFSAGDTIAGIVLLALVISLTYADTYAVFEDGSGAPIFLRSFWRSTLVAWGGLETIGRTISILALQLAFTMVSERLQARLNVGHIASAPFWAQAVLGTITVPVVSVLTALVYLDATGHETERMRAKL